MKSRNSLQITFFLKKNIHIYIRIKIKIEYISTYGLFQTDKEPLSAYP